MIVIRCKPTSRRHRYWCLLGELVLELACQIGKKTILLLIRVQWTTMHHQIGSLIYLTNNPKLGHLVLLMALRLIVAPITAVAAIKILIAKLAHT